MVYNQKGSITQELQNQVMHCDVTKLVTNFELLKNILSY